ncbi:Arp2/3 complex subunit, actin nucleation center [Xylographa carneopallida]|nr:Arp2/3 complex subunit, actin nucleation center [Xylographa carneopallida]
MTAKNGTTVIDNAVAANEIAGESSMSITDLPSTNGTHEGSDSKSPEMEEPKFTEPKMKETEPKKAEEPKKPEVVEIPAVPAANGSNGTSRSNGTDHTATNGTEAVASPYQPLKDKVALVTGSGRGIGAGIAMELAKKGASVVIHYASSSGAAAEVVKDIEATGVRAYAIKAELTKLDEIESLFEQAVAHFGRLDIVASNSGKEMFVPLAQTTLEDYNEIFDLNTRAQFFVAKAAFQHLSPGGRLILMSSIAAGIGVPGHSLYAGSKSAVEGFTRCFAADFGSKGCTVNAIAPAGVKSDMWSQNSWRYAPGCDKTSSIEQVEEALANGSPLKRCAVPADVGRVVAFLASPEGEWVNGKIDVYQDLTTRSRR